MVTGTDAKWLIRDTSVLFVLRRCQSPKEKEKETPARVAPIVGEFIGLLSFLIIPLIKAQVIFPEYSTTKSDNCESPKYPGSRQNGFRVHQSHEWPGKHGDQQQPKTESSPSASSSASGFAWNGHGGGISTPIANRN